MFSWRMWQVSEAKERNAALQGVLRSPEIENCTGIISNLDKNRATSSKSVWTEILESGFLRTLPPTEISGVLEGGEGSLLLDQATTNGWLICPVNSDDRDRHLTRLTPHEPVFRCISNLQQVVSLEQAPHNRSTRSFKSSSNASLASFLDDMRR